MIVSASPARVVELACLAPSIHNTQPWRWRTDGRSIELYADPRRRLTVTDPDGRSLTISCGAALHHAQVAARALGWEPTVSRLPDGPGEDLLARMTLEPRSSRTSALGELNALQERCTDRRRFTSWPMQTDQVQALASVAAAAGGSATALADVTDRIQVELLVSRALERQLLDPAIVEEQQAWTNRDAADGIPTAAIPMHAALTRSRRSRFGPDLLDATDHQQVEVFDGLIVLGGRSDDRRAWLATGEGLSALWLKATKDGVSVVPLSQLVEVEETRSALHHGVLGGRVSPHILVRLGWQPIGRGTQTRTPRRQLSEVCTQGRSRGSVTIVPRGHDERL